MRRILWLAVVLVAFCRPPALAQEEPPLEDRPEAAEFAHRLVRGDPIGGEELQIAREFLSRNILRPPMLDLGQSARYSVAEIYLERHEPAKAAARLEEIVAGVRPDADPDDTAAITLLNIGNIHRFHAADVDRAVVAYQRITGYLEPLALREILDACAKARRPERAVRHLESRVEKTQDIGERMALLNMLGQLYRKTGQTDKAIEIFDQIARDGSREKMQALRDQAVADVRNAFREVRRLQAADRWEEAERAIRGAARRINALRLQERHAEAEAARAEMERQERDLDQWHRQRGEGARPEEQGGAEGQERADEGRRI